MWEYLKLKMVSKKKQFYPIGTTIKKNCEVNSLLSCKELNKTFIILTHIDMQKPEYTYYSNAFQFKVKFSLV